MDKLARRVERDLEERHFCVVFEDEVERCWPSEKPLERERQIQDFANSRGWKAFILDTDCGRTRAIFSRR
jgi:hypothetical protein